MDQEIEYPRCPKSLTHCVDKITVWLY